MLEKYSMLKMNVDDRYIRTNVDNIPRLSVYFSILWKPNFGPPSSLQIRCSKALPERMQSLFLLFLFLPRRRRRFRLIEE